MISSGLYKRFDGLKLFANGHNFKLEHDSKRRCFRMYQKGKVLRDQAIDLQTEQYLKSGLEGEGGYFEKINKSWPMNSYMLLDARAVNALIKNSLVKTPKVTIEDAGKEKEIEIKKIEKETKIGKKEIHYLVPNSIKLKKEGDDNKEKTKIKKRECIYKKPYFGKNYALLNKEMGKLIIDNFPQTDDGYITLFGKKCKIEQDGKNYKLFQINKKNKKENLDQNLFVMMNSLQIDSLSEEGYKKKYIAVNERAWREKYADKFKNKFSKGSEVALTQLANSEQRERDNIIKELLKSLNSNVISKLLEEISKEKLKKISRKSQELLDKTSKELSKILESDNLSELLEAPKKLKELYKNLSKEKLEKIPKRLEKLSEEVSKDLKEVYGFRIWRDKRNYYRTCVDNENGIFISTYPNDKNKIAFSKYLKGEAYLRRKQSLALPVIPVWRREFVANKESESQLKIIIDGGDDTANGVVNSGAPEKLAAAIQSLLLFPAFLSFVKIGIDGLAEEKVDTREELHEIRLKIVDCEKMLQDFIGDSANVSAEKIGEIFTSIKDLKNSLKDLNIVKIESKASATFGHPAMISMFSAVAAYEIEAIFKLFGGIDGLTRGVGQFSFFTGLETKGVDAAATAELMKVGGLNILGNSLAFMGQALMTCYAAGKAYADFKSIGKLNEDIKAIKESDVMSEFVKKIVLQFKKDEKFYKKLTVTGNTSLASGQLIMLLGGPMGFAINPMTYVGLSLTLGGVGLNTATALREKKLYAYNDEEDEIEKKLSDICNNKLFESVIKTIGNEIIKSNKIKDLLVLERDNQELEIEQKEEKETTDQILYSKSYSMELLSYLRAVNLSTNKILKESKNSKSLQTGLNNSKNHYKSRNHQSGLFNFVDKISSENKENLENYLNYLKNKGDEEYLLMWNDYIGSLEVKEDNLEYIERLGSLLYQYDKNKEERESIIIKIMESEIPKSIKDSIRSSIEEKNQILTYDELILAIQNGYMFDKTKNLISKAREEYSVLNKEKKIQTLTKSLLESSFVKDFEKTLMKESYTGSDKEKYVYKEGKPVKIIGQLKKEEGIRFYHKTHYKNIYGFNEEVFKYINDNDPSYTPKLKTLKNFFHDEIKFNLRSGYHRLIRELPAISEEKEAVGQIVELEKFRKIVNSNSIKENPKKPVHDSMIIRENYNMKSKQDEEVNHGEIELDITFTKNEKDHNKSFSFRGEEDLKIIKKEANKEPFNSAKKLTEEQEEKIANLIKQREEEVVTFKLESDPRYKQILAEINPSTTISIKKSENISDIQPKIDIKSNIDVKSNNKENLFTERELKNFSNTDQYFKKSARVEIKENPEIKIKEFFEEAILKQINQERINGGHHGIGCQIIMEENRKLRIRLTNDNNNAEDKYKLERVKTFTTPTLNAVINAINTSNKKIIEMETLGRGMTGIFDKEITFTINNASEFSNYISNEYAKDIINSVIRGVRAGYCR